MNWIDELEQGNKKLETIKHTIHCMIEFEVNELLPLSYILRSIHSLFGGLFFKLLAIFVQTEFTLILLYLSYRYIFLRLSWSWKGTSFCSVLADSPVGLIVWLLNLTSYHIFSDWLMINWSHFGIFLSWFGIGGISRNSVTLSIDRYLEKNRLSRNRQ